MSLNNLLNQFMGSAATTSGQSSNQGNSGGFGQTVSNMASQIPGGLAGGAALLGGMAFKAYQNWQGSQQNLAEAAIPEQSPADPPSFHQRAVSQQTDQSTNPELVLVKAMIAAAKADGHIDADEQQRIFQAVEKTGMSASEKGLIFDYLQKDIPVFELTSGVTGI